MNKAILLVSGQTNIRINFSCHLEVDFGEADISKIPEKGTLSLLDELERNAIGGAYLAKLPSTYTTSRSSVDMGSLEYWILERVDDKIPF